MKLGLLSVILSDRSYRQVVDYCSETGFQTVEAACWPQEKAVRRYAGVSHLNVSADARGSLYDEIEYTHRKNVEISAFAYYPNPLSQDTEESARAVGHIRNLIAAASDTGVGQVNTFIGRNRFLDVEENLRQYKEVWSPIIELAEKKNVRIAIENCPMYFSKDEWPGGNNLAITPFLWKEMFRLIDSPMLGLNYDPSHLVVQDMDYIKPVYEFRDKIFHVHFKDVHISRDRLDEYGRFSYPLTYITPRLPGLGDIDWAAFCRALYDIRYDGAACIEIEDKAFEDTPELLDKGIGIAYRHISNFM